MRIENLDKLKMEGYLRVYDLEGGECFIFLDDNKLYMKADDGDRFVSVTDGEIIEIDDGHGNNYEDRPIKKVDVKVVIL